MNRFDTDLMPQALPEGWVPGEGLHLGGMIVGEAPGVLDWEEKRPFMSEAGQLLRKELIASGVHPEDMYMTNVVKVMSSGPGEIEAALPYLKEEIQHVVPKYILALGEVPYQTLTGSELGLTLYRGFWARLSEEFDWDEALVLPTYDPASVMRNTRLFKTWRRDLTEFATAWLKGAPNVRD